jgi:Fe2+ or Zn2+ uptake regulation protein
MGMLAQEYTEEAAAVLRLTPQRLAILEVLRATTCHPDASWVHQEVRKRLPRISLGTVYRNLAQLAEAGLIRELLVEQTSHWDGTTAPHDHVLCLLCGRIGDVRLPAVFQGLDQAAARSSCFTVLRHQLQFVGTCPACDDAGKAP